MRAEGRNSWITRRLHAPKSTGWSRDCKVLTEAPSSISGDGARATRVRARSSVVK